MTFHILRDSHYLISLCPHSRNRSSSQFRIAKHQREHHSFHVRPIRKLGMWNNTIYVNFILELTYIPRFVARGRCCNRWQFIRNRVATFHLQWNKASSLPKNRFSSLLLISLLKFCQISLTFIVCQPVFRPECMRTSHDQASGALLNHRVSNYFHVMIRKSWFQLDWVKQRSHVVVSLLLCLPLYRLLYFRIFLLPFYWRFTISDLFFIIINLPIAFTRRSRLGPYVLTGNRFCFRCYKFPLLFQVVLLVARLALKGCHHQPTNKWGIIIVFYWRTITLWQFQKEEHTRLFEVKTSFALLWIVFRAKAAGCA